ncbi:hypothetical protein ACS0TY_001328 [Phlomoides rotata]
MMWSKVITEALVTFLLTRQAAGTWSWDSNNLPSIIEAREYLNSTFNLDYTDIEVLGRVKKLRSRFNLFNHMISTSGVVWDQVVNFVHASVEQWKRWKEVYPLSRAYTFHGEPLFAQLKTLFGPDEEDDGEGLILIVDSEDEDNPHYHEEVVHALPTADPYAPIIPELVIISSDSDSDDIYDMFDSEVDIDFTTDEEVDGLEQVGSEPVVEVIDGFLNSDDEVNTPNTSDPIDSETRFYFDDAFVSRDSYYLRDGFTTSDSDSD